MGITRTPLLDIRGLRIMLFRILCFFVLICNIVNTAECSEDVSLNWLGDKTPTLNEGISWGVPWPKGQVKKSDQLAIQTSNGRSIPIQSWPLAYWPDGSLKWTGHTIVTTPEISGGFSLSTGIPAKTETPVKIIQNDNHIEIDTGIVRCKLLKQGSNLIESLTIGERIVAQKGNLILLLEDRSEYESEGVLREIEFTSIINSLTIEQSGPLRAVIKVEGMHYSSEADRTWLPFTVRFYFYAGLGQIRIVHSFIFDGEADKDFVKGLGISFKVPFAEEFHNRHIRFAGDGTGMWVQPVRLLPGYRNRVRANIYNDQLAGKPTPNLSEYDSRTQEAIETCPLWSGCKLTQLGPNGFSINKRTGNHSSWLHVTDGRRSLGLAMLADVSGGIAISVKDFWQKYPSSFEINEAASETGELKVWFWSPEGQPMDMRHYDIIGHNLSVNYEDWKPGWSTPEGIANTTEMTLWALSDIPSNTELINMAKTGSESSMLVCTPEYYHSIPVFGHWSLPDRSTKTQRWTEDHLDGLLKFLMDQVEQRYWYGFWNYGDIMHHYDFDRHEWRYDIGGWAWMNTELMPDIFLWYSFLRTGRRDIYRMAEAMTRHTSEVDVHHIGRFSPLGTRHNVSHWGDGAKQPRISHSGLKNIYYYLTTDERIGDLMREQLTADEAYNRVKAMDPRRQGRRGPGPGGGQNSEGQGRGAQLRREQDRPNNTRFGLDWTCYAINWATEWERTGDTMWRDKVLEGMKEMTSGEPDGGLYGGGYFDMLFGGPEIMFQLKPMFDAPEFWKGWINWCESNGKNMEGSRMTGPVLTAYAAKMKNDPELGRRAWEQLVGNAVVNQKPRVASSSIQEPDVVNPVQDPVFLGSSVGWQLHGAGTVHWALNAIETLELASDYIDEYETYIQTEVQR
jgi:hypothetical protein